MHKFSVKVLFVLCLALSMPAVLITGIIWVSAVKWAVVTGLNNIGRTFPQNSVLSKGYIPLNDTVTAQSPPSCTHYASPTGSGGTCTESTPCLVSTWLNATTTMAVPGNTLCLNDGTYTGSNSMIRVPSTGFAGTAQNPITIRALNEGQVLINGGGSRPVDIYGSYGVLWGINVTEGDNHLIRFREVSANWKVQRVVVWETKVDLGDSRILVNGTNNLLEDCAVFGSGRKGISAGQSSTSPAPTGNVIRRCWSRWETNEHASSNPENSFEVGYTQDFVISENNIGTWNRRAGGNTDGPEGIIQVFATRNSKVLGSIYYVLSTDTFDPFRIAAGLNDGGSHAQQGNYHNTQNLLFKHNVAFIHPSHSRFGSVRPFQFSEDSDNGGASPDGTNNVIDSIVGVGGLANSFSTGSWDTVTNVQYGTTLAGAIGTGNSIWTDSVAAPGICKRYVAGSLTTDPLWPWPMNQRIIDAMTTAGVTPVDVTATMEILFGPIPIECTTAGAPPVGNRNRFSGAY